MSQARAVTATFAVDTTPPTTTITSGPAAGSTVTSASVTFGFSANETSTFECSYDGAAYTQCSSPGPGTSGSDTRSLGNGVHTFNVRARDTANNVDASPESRTFTVTPPPPPPPPPAGDTTPPQTTIDKGLPKTLKAKRAVVVKVEFSSSEPGSTFSCRLDGGSASGCSSPATFRLRKGRHTLAIVATDAAGNTDISPASTQVQVKKKKRKKKRGKR